LIDRKLTVGSLIKEDVKSLEIKEPDHDINLTETNKESKPNNHTDQSEILISQNNTTFSVKPLEEETLLDSALQQGHALQYKCKKGTCGQCTVQVLKGKDQLNSPNNQEKIKLNESLNDEYRLACQTLFI
jgi:2Fe-2S ferredoxin